MAKPVSFECIPPVTRFQYTLAGETVLIEAGTPFATDSEQLVIELEQNAAHAVRRVDGKAKG